MADKTKSCAAEAAVVGTSNVDTSAAAATAAAVKPHEPSAPKESILRRDNEEYKIVRKLPSRFPKSDNDIYITKKTDFKAQLEKCTYMIRNFKKSDDFVVLHAMGPAINRAVNLALKLKKERTYLDMNCYTSSIEMEDDLIPLMDNLDISVQHRFISAIHIKISNRFVTQ